MWPHCLRKNRSTYSHFMFGPLSWQLCLTGNFTASIVEHISIFRSHWHWILETVFFRGLVMMSYLQLALQALLDIFFDSLEWILEIVLFHGVKVIFNHACKWVLYFLYCSTPENANFQQGRKIEWIYTLCAWSTQNLGMNAAWSGYNHSIYI